MDPVQLQVGQFQAANELNQIQLLPGVPEALSSGVGGFRALRPYRRPHSKGSRLQCLDCPQPLILAFLAIKNVSA